MGTQEKEEIEKMKLANRLLKAHGYKPRFADAFEIIGERKNYKFVEDVDIVFFASDLNIALNRYFKYVRHTTPNISEVYYLPRTSRLNLICMINEDPAFKGRLDFLLEKGLIIGPGDERKVYQQLVHFNRRAINSEVLSRSLDKVIIKVKSGIGSSKQSDVRVHDDKHGSVI